MTLGEGMKKILVADVPQMDARYQAAAAGWELAFARTTTQACHALASSPFDLVAVGVYFDDSRMFDLVRAIRGDPDIEDLPIVCVRGRPGFTAVTGRTLEMTLKALGADEFVDLAHFGDDASGQAGLRATIERLLLPQG